MLQDAVLTRAKHPTELIEEDLQMTFQLALVGNDGVLVGSDRKVAYVTRENGRSSDLQFEEGAKFSRSEDSALICFFAGGPQAKTIADAVVNRGSRDGQLSGWHQDLQKTAETIRSSSIGDEIIVVRLAANGFDVSLINKTNDTASVSPITQRRCTGVNTKARFLTEHFWVNTGVDDLRHLALVALGFAARERPSEVGGGFDVMLLSNGKVSWERYTADDAERACIDFCESAIATLFPYPGLASGSNLPRKTPGL